MKTAVTGRNEISILTDRKLFHNIKLREKKQVPYTSYTQKFCAKHEKNLMENRITR